MDHQYAQIQELLHQKADLQARLNLLPYDGTPEIKESGESKYLYVRKRVGSRQTSTYVGIYSEELYQLLRDLDINLVEHIIVANPCCYAILKQYTKDLRSGNP